MMVDVLVLHVWKEIREEITDVLQQHSESDRRCACAQTSGDSLRADRRAEHRCARAGREGDPLLGNVFPSVMGEAEG